MPSSEIISGGFKWNMQIIVVIDIAAFLFIIIHMIISMIIIIAIATIMITIIVIV